jgi:hypothetical protein
MKKKEKLEISALCLSNGGYIFSVSDGDPEKRIAAFISSHADKEITVIFDASYSRSKEQNRFYNGCLVPAIQRVLELKGMPRAYDRDFIKKKIIEKPYLTVYADTPEEYQKSTSSLSVNEFWNFCNYALNLLLSIGGELNDDETDQLNKIVQKFHLEKSVEEYLAHNYGKG